MTLPRGLGFFPGRIARQMLGLFGHRFIADELPARGISAGENKAALVAFSKYQFLSTLFILDSAFPESQVSSGS